MGNRFQKGGVPMTTHIAGIGANWKSVGGQLLVSGLAMLSVRQDLGLRIPTGAAFWFLIAMAFSVSALITATQGNVSYAPAICAVVLCSEVLLVLIWIVRSGTKKNPQ
jgi:hypothetical protein